MKLLKNGSKVGIVACANGFDAAYEPKLRKLCESLTELGFIPILSHCIYGKNSTFSGTGKERAAELMSFYEAEDIDAIFDISGGNLANEVIPWLDYQSIMQHPKPMFGYSDLTCVLNAIYAKTGVPTYLYQIRNIMYEYAMEQKTYVRESLMEGKDKLYSFPVEWVQGSCMEGIVVGGNIRCLLKLAGTPYFPEVKDKILVLEAYGGKPEVMASFLAQLKQMGVLEQLSGILLGTFTEMEEKQFQPTIEELVQNAVENKNLPIAKTKWIGHGVDSKCIRIGESLRIV